MLEAKPEPLFILEMRSRPNRRWGIPRGEWERLCEELLTRADIEECFADCDPRDPDFEYRARMHPEFGYEVIVPRWRSVNEAEPLLARNMPASVHKLNDDILSDLGV